jgi:hypothetical protein
MWLPLAPDWSFSDYYASTCGGDPLFCGSGKIAVRFKRIKKATQAVISRDKVKEEIILFNG